MPTRSFFQLFFVQTSIHDSGVPHDPHRKFSENTTLSLIFPSQRKDCVLYGFTFYLGLSFSLGIAFVVGPVLYRNPYRSKASLKQCVCTVLTKRNVRALMEGGKNLGASRGKSPCLLFLSHARKVWSAGAGICQALAVRRGCDVSHFRMDSTMCGMPPSFFLFFLSCQMNACSLGYRTEEVIHQKWCKRTHDSEFFFFQCAHHSLFVCHSSGPQTQGLVEQCKISTANAHINTKQSQPTKMLRHTECRRYVLYRLSLQASALI